MSTQRPPSSERTSSVPDAHYCCPANVSNRRGLRPGRWGVQAAMPSPQPVRCEGPVSVPSGGPGDVRSPVWGPACLCALQRVVGVSTYPQKPFAIARLCLLDRQHLTRPVESTNFGDVLCQVPGSALLQEVVPALRRSLVYHNCFSGELERRVTDLEACRCCSELSPARGRNDDFEDEPLHRRECGPSIGAK